MLIASYLANLSVMNPFYRRLVTFGQLIQHLGHLNQTNYNQFFEVEHPGHLAFSNPKAVKPKLHFTKPCPKEQRSQIKEMFDLCFSRRQAA